MKTSAYILLFGILLSVMGCGKRTPDGVIPPETMEQLLYDYQQTEAVNGEMSHKTGSEQQELLRYVFRKYGVTVADFDSSMVWYTRHPQYLLDIYANVEKRFQKDEQHLTALQAKWHTPTDSESLSGDTINVWRERSIRLLYPTDVLNKVLFHIETDSTFHVRDSLCLIADVSLLGKLDSTQRVIGGLSLTFNNDSIIGVTASLKKDGRLTLSLRPDTALTYRAIHAFFYLTPPAQAQSGMAVLHHLQLLRYHVKDTSALSETITETPAIPRSLREELPEAPPEEL